MYHDIIKFLLDGRNHTSCCFYRGIPDNCLHYCAMTQEQAEEYSIDFADIVCSRYIHDAMQCFREGVGEYRKYSSVPK